MSNQRGTQVIVVGAGPVGLALAMELARGGVRTVVVERLTEADETIKASMVGPIAATTLRRRGLGDAIADIEKAAMERIAAFMKQRGPAGKSPVIGAKTHFAGLWKLDPALLDRPRIAGVTEFAPAMLPQHVLEQLLERHVRELGVEIMRGAGVDGVEQDDDGVTVTVGETTLRAAYLVGCDGGRSTVRKAAGFDFPGTDPVITGHQAMVTLDDPDAIPAGWHRTGRGVYAYGPMPGRVLTVEFDGPPVERDAPITRQELQDSLRNVTGVDVTVTGVQTSTRFTDNARQVTDYRNGRVLLAGDAAHVHSPFGGQGLNLGLGDAFNLGWKLATVVNGAPAELLDTYTAERHPVGAQVLANTRAQVALMRPDAHTSALRELFADLMDLPAVNSTLLSMMAGFDIRYEDGAGLAGQYCPELAVADGRTLAELSATGRGILLDFTDCLPDAEIPGVDIVRTKAEAAEALDLSAALVRPDGYLAWTAPYGGPVDRAALDAALNTWFGAAVLTA